jgi:hypothetical protein
MFVPTIDGGGTTTSGTPTTLVAIRAPGGRLIATGSRAAEPGAIVPKFVPTVLFTPTGPDGNVEDGNPPIPFVRAGLVKVLAGGNRNVG